MRTSINITRDSYPCFKPGDCPSHWVIETHGWGHVRGPQPFEFIVGLQWTVQGENCPYCKAKRGKPCLAEVATSTRTGRPLEAPNKSGAHYARLQECRRAASRRRRTVELAVEERTELEHKLAFYKRQRSVLRRKADERRARAAGKKLPPRRVKPRKPRPPKELPPFRELTPRERDQLGKDRRYDFEDDVKKKLRQKQGKPKTGMAIRSECNQIWAVVQRAGMVESTNPLFDPAKNPSVLPPSNCRQNTPPYLWRGYYTGPHDDYERREGRGRKARQ
jgi:hypothetical protein